MLIKRTSISTLIAAVTLATSVAPAIGATLNFEITYTTQSGMGCSISCLSIPTSLLPAPYTKTFSLTTAQLAVDGSYDISSFIGPTLFVAQPGAVSSLTALAVVSGGHVVDATVNFSETYPVPLISSTALINFTAGGASFTDLHEVSIVSTDLQGVYTIAELPPSPVPEPGSFAAAGAGLGLLFAARRWVRRRRVSAGI